MRPLLLGMCTLLALAGCSGGTKGDNSSSGAGAGATGSQESQNQPQNLSSDQQNMAVPVQLPSPQAVKAIPASFRGRWATVAHDCTSGGPGLLVVDERGLTIGGRKLASRSIAVAGGNALTVETAQANASGGPQTERLSLIDEGRTLVRPQQAPAAAPNYRRCPA